MTFTWPGQIEMRKVGIEAAQYAVVSLGHTTDIAGFENRPLDKKATNIATGQVGQRWLYEFCIMNNIRYVPDQTHHTRPDVFDIVLYQAHQALPCEVKTTWNGQLPCQVMSHTKERDEETVRHYIFLTTRKGHTFVEPIGTIPFEDYWAYCTCHEKGSSAGASVPIGALDTAKLLECLWGFLTPFETFMSNVDRRG